MHLNTRSLPDKFDKFKICLTNLDNEKINFIIREDLSIFIEKSFETFFLEVTSSKGSILIGEVYRVPNSSCPNSITNYELITNKLQNENKEIKIGTDQNFDYLNIHCAYSKHLLETFFAACLVPTITRPTRITSESATLIDNILYYHQLCLRLSQTWENLIAPCGADVTLTAFCLIDIHDVRTQTNKMASAEPFMFVKLTDNDVPGIKIPHNDFDNRTNTELKRWLTCHGLKTGGNRKQLLQRYETPCHGRSDRLRPTPTAWSVEVRTVTVSVKCTTVNSRNQTSATIDCY